MSVANLIKKITITGETPTFDDYYGNIKSFVDYYMITGDSYAMQTFVKTMLSDFNKNTDGSYDNPATIDLGDNDIIILDGIQVNNKKKEIARMLDIVALLILQYPSTKDLLKLQYIDILGRGNFESTKTKLFEIAGNKKSFRKNTILPELRTILQIPSNVNTGSFVTPSSYSKRYSDMSEDTDDETDKIINEILESDYEYDYYASSSDDDQSEATSEYSTTDDEVGFMKYKDEQDSGNTERNVIIMRGNIDFNDLHDENFDHEIYENGPEKVITQDSEKMTDEDFQRLIQETLYDDDNDNFQTNNNTASHTIRRQHELDNTKWDSKEYLASVDDFLLTEFDLKTTSI